MTTAPVPFGLSQIGQISITVHDVQKAIGFYRDTLGMRFLFEVPNMAFFECGGVRLMLGVPVKPEFDHPASILYYKVDDIHATFNILSARGVQFDAKPHLAAQLSDHDLWLAFLRDMDNNLLALMCEVRR